MTTATAQQTETVTARRIRRVRCTGCTELFARDLLTDGQCSRCNSIVEMTDPITGETFLAITEPVYLSEVDRGEMGISVAPALPEGFFSDEHDSETLESEAVSQRGEDAVEIIAREIRCAGCTEWALDSDLIDGMCQTCHDCHAQIAFQESISQAVIREQEQAAALAEVERLMVSSATSTPVAARTPGWQPAAWELVIMVGSQKSVIETALTFDDAQRAARTLAKAEAAEYNERRDEGVEPVRAIWRNVKRWDVADFHIEIHKIG
jgi:phage FluMu protein Com